MVMLGQKFNYADENVKCVVKSSLATRCLGYWLCSDTEVNSEFTGMMSWEDSIRWHLRACQRFHHCLDIKEVGVSSWRACDRDFLPQRVIRDHAHKPEVLFAELDDRIPSMAMERLLQFSTADIVDKTESARRIAQAGHFLHSQRGLFFPPDYTSSSLFHGGDPMPVLSPAARARLSDTEATSLSDGIGAPRKNIFTCGSTPCVAFSPRNRVTGGPGHTSLLTTHMFFAEAAEMSNLGVEDVRFHECVLGLKGQERCMRPTQPDMRWVTCRTNPVDEWGVLRHRELSAGWSEERFAWLGGDGVQEAFDATFGINTQQPLGSAALYLHGQENQEQQELRELRDRMKVGPQGTMVLFDALTPAEKDRYRAFKVAYKQGTGAHAFADLGQCPGFAKEPTAVFQQSHGMHS